MIEQRVSASTPNDRSRKHFAEIRISILLLLIMMNMNKNMHPKYSKLQRRNSDEIRNAAEIILFVPN